MQTSEYRRCPRCDTAKSPEQFTTSPGRQESLCKACRAMASQVRKARRYGLTVARIREMLAGPCEICGRRVARIGIDHCHETGRARGPLCHGCNAAIGLLAEDPDRMRRAAAYVEYHRENTLPLGPLPPAASTECPQGHPYGPDHTGTRADGRSYCKTCDRQRHRRVKEAWAARAAASCP